MRDSGVVELLGGPAAHPFLPLLLPEVAALALQSGLADSTWRLGERPRGIWSPECGWTPSLRAAFDAAGVGHLVVDEQLVLEAGGHPHAAWRVKGSDVVAVPRDLEVTNLVWSSRTGYPAAAPYRDFHSREEFTGIRLWAVGSDTGGASAIYDPAAASDQVDRDVAHFVAAVRARLEQSHATTGRPGLVVAAYDTELFGHWWHEGPVFVGRAIRALRANGVRVDTVENALARDGSCHVGGELDLGAGSWGAGKDFSVWDGPAVSGIAHENLWLQHRWLDLVARERAAGLLGARRRDLDQLLLTLWNALSSDWAFLVTRGQSVDYALRRADEHRADFHRLAQLIEEGASAGALTEAARQARHNRCFPELDARLGPP